MEAYVFAFIFICVLLAVAKAIHSKDGENSGGAAHAEPAADPAKPTEAFRETSSGASDSGSAGQSHDCKSCGAHAVAGKICPFCGQDL